MQDNPYRAPILLNAVVDVRLFSLACWCNVMGEDVAWRAPISLLDEPLWAIDSGRLGVLNNAIRDGLYG